MIDDNSNQHQAIVNAIRSMISQGYSYVQIKSFMQQKGYAESSILNYYNQAAQSVQPVPKKPAQMQPAQQVQQTQTSQQHNNQQLIQIVNYIKNMETRGYNFQQIKNFLMQKGYSQNLIDEAAAHLPSQQQENNVIKESSITHKHELHLPSKTAIHIIAIFICIIIVGGGMFYFLSPKNNTQSALLDLSVEAQNPKLYAGETLYFDISVLSMSGINERFDMLLTYSVKNNEGLEVLREEETVAISTSTKLTEQIILPEELSPGRYTVKVISNYNARNAMATFEFMVMAKSSDSNQEEEEGEQTNNQETPVIPGQETPPGYNPAPEIEEPEENVEVISFKDFLDRIIQTSNNNPQIAVKKCRSIKETQNIDRCIENVALEFEDPEICAEITNSSVRDDCYIAQLINGKTEVCDKVIDENLKNNCQMIKDLYLIQEYENSGNPPDIEKLAEELGLELTITDYSYDNEIEIIQLED